MQTLRVHIPEWFPSEQLAKLIASLGGNDCTRIVGGTVRDLLLDRINTDIDLATVLTPSEVQATLQRHGVKTIPTGLKHGTLSAIYAPGSICEITTLRRDIACDGRWAKVEFTDRWEEDALRRDFTINAMFMDLEGNVYDYCGGLIDIGRMLVRFVGNPEQRIEEDALRILRYFRLYSYLGGNNIDQPSLKAASSLANRLTTLSGERVRNEMMKLLVNPYGKTALLLMLEQKVGDHIDLAGINLDAIKAFNLGNDGLANLAAIIRTSPEPIRLAAHVSTAWRLSGKETKALEFLCGDLSQQPLQQLQADFRLHKKQLYLLSPHLYLHYVMLLNITQNVDKSLLDGIIEMAENYIEPKLPISGDDLLAAGFSHIQLKQELEYIKKLWIDSDFTLGRLELLRSIRRKI